MRASLPASAGIIIAVAFLVIISAYIEPPQLSTSWGGMSQLALQATPVTNPERLLGGPCRLLVIAAPQLTPSEKELAYLRKFVELGGVVVIASSGTIANDYLRGLGVNMQVTNLTISDPLLALNSSLEISALLQPSLNLNTSRSIVLLNSSPISLGVGARPLAYTSPFSIAASGHNNLTGPFVVAAYQDIGQGVVVVLSSPYVFVNGLFPYNGWLLSNLANGSKTCLAYFAWALPPAYLIKLSVKGVLEYLHPYALSSIVTIAAGAMFYIYYPSGRAPSLKDEIEEAKARLPWADERLLGNLVEERRESFGPG